MTTKEIAKHVNKDERSVQRWVKTLSDKNSLVNDKMSSSSPMKPADYDLREVCLIIEEGMGKEVADVFRINAVDAELLKQNPRKVKLPSGVQMNVMLTTYGPKEAGRRFDFLIGFSSKLRESAKLIEPVAPQEQGLLQFEEIKSRYGK